ncbi:hypothetical protein CC80DRAFT_553465 [Byssothecium circinans]|uniref:F-box domain-containing protein n=1 Tax=Byssothecium circinans TaxID=147558 RepID=A0A6A5THY6_9PLEO|nr:hypothetical protein CC80DRAFT_553465 [Byssothecium circinans]
MASLTSLSNELLLNIASLLDQSSLWSLSLVNKQIHPIAQDQLYSQPFLPSPYNYDGSLNASETTNRLLHLLRTLLVHPRLAARVRRLSFTTAFAHEPKHDQDFKELCTKATGVITQVTEGHELWFKRWSSVLLHIVPNPNAWAGVLLSICPLLEDLELEHLDPQFVQPGVSWKGYYEMAKLGIDIESLFGDSDFGLWQIPGLRNLQHIRFISEEFSGQWCQLPKLYSVDLPYGQVLYDAGGEAIEWADWCMQHDAPNITHVNMTRMSSDFASDSSLLGKAMESFLFTRVKNLQLYFQDTCYFVCGGTDSHLSDMDGYYDDLIVQLAPLANQLEHLRIDVANNDFPGFLFQRVAPLGMRPQLVILPSFAQLNVLILPQAALFQMSTDELRPVMSLDTLLPPSLERLDLLYPTFEFVYLAPWFQESRHHLPHLNTINLRCRPGVGTPFQEMLSLVYHPGWALFWLNGIYLIPLKDLGEVDRWNWRD